ncbi:MAG: DUF3822 family protein [Bacteroidetes bacterium]|nr:DUF3822 family protein [Bacteroidota bacterium]MBK9799308.1 DUF3822 family protein [Bacteroidota bacterium]MBP6411854.1 DUF3822 family protein [Bacteroidia bacterium]
MAQSTNSTIQPLQSFKDEIFSPQAALRYHLSLELSYSGLSYCILDSEKNKYLLFENYSFQKINAPELLAIELVKLVENTELLTLPYKSVSLSFNTLKFTFVPDALYDSLLSNAYLKFNIPLLDSELIFTDSVKILETHCVYAIDSKLVAAITQLFPRVKIVHTLSSLLEVTGIAYKNSASKTLVIHLQQNHFELLVMEDKKLLFANIFAFQTAEDFLYYTLFVCEQLKLNPESMEFRINGEVEKNSAIILLLSKYVRNIKFGKRPEMFEYSYVFDSVPSHFYFNLFSQVLCVL